MFGGPARTFLSPGQRPKDGREPGHQATLLIDVLRSYVAARKFRLHDFVIMPDHAHLLITVQADTDHREGDAIHQGRILLSIEKEFGYSGEVWQRGFSEVRVDDRESFLQHREYIAQNPVKAGLVDSPEKFPYCFTYLAVRKAAGATAR